jgi:RNA-directed DNA polymerase
MKRYGNLYEKIYDIENLRMAHRMARKGKAHYKEVKMVDADTDKYLYRLQKTLINKTYKTSKYKTFTIMDKGKEREISRLPYYPDRICQWAIMLQLEKIFVNNFIFDTYASIPRKGIHLAVNRIKKAMERKIDVEYCFKFDIKKYFPNIDHGILKQKIRSKFKDKDLIYLIDEIIDSVESGLPIGNYLSQYLSNFYLSDFDHWIKEKLMIKHYFRYMDDVLIFSDSKDQLKFIKCWIEEYLKDNLKLKLKENWQIFPTFSRGIDFLGYRCFDGYVLLRKIISKRIKRKISKISKRNTKENDLNSVMSYMGWLKYCNSHNFCKKHMNKTIRRLKNEKSTI